MTPAHKLAVVPGDGIGPEVTAEAVRVLEQVAGAHNFSVELNEFDLGADRYLRTGEVLPDSVLSELAGFRAVLMGAVGDPRVAPGVLEGGLLLRLRQELDLYVNLRPAKLFSGVDGPLRDRGPGDLDVVIVRENTEGLYCRRGTSQMEGTGGEIATEMSLNTAPAVERIVRFAFEAAASAGKTLTLVHKTNVLEHAGGLYVRTMKLVGAEFAEVKTAYQHVDAAALLLVEDPSRFEFIITDNLFGDILSDLTAALAGGIGLVGSANIHPGKTSIFEPVHGSAPDIAGTGKANPIGAILSAALMLDHLGEHAGAQSITRSVELSAAKAAGGSLACSQIGQLILDNLT